MEEGAGPPRCSSPGILPTTSDAVPVVPRRRVGLDAARHTWVEFSAQWSASPSGRPPGGEVGGRATAHRCAAGLGIGPQHSLEDAAPRSTGARGRGAGAVAASRRERLLRDVIGTSPSFVLLFGGKYLTRAPNVGILTTLPVRELPNNKECGSGG